MLRRVDLIIDFCDLIIDSCSFTVGVASSYRFALSDFFIFDHRFCIHHFQLMILKFTISNL